MDLQTFFIFNKSFNILIIIFSTLMFEALSVDSRFTTCIPQNCGNGPNISYPFWIPPQQESYCGSPGFNITCHDNNPVLTVSEDDYIVRDIFYANNSFLLANAGVYDEGNTCPTPVHNFSIEGTPFSYGPAYADLYFVYNCTYLNGHATYSVDCVSNATRHSFAVFNVELLEERNYSVESCQGPVNAHVDGDSLARLLKINFTGILKKGFVLEWSGYNCSNCKISGGRCGSFNNEFNCFCNDHSHLRTCNTSFGAASIVLLCICSIIYCIRKYSKTTSLPFCKRETENSKKVEAFIKQYGSSTPRRYRYSEIEKITNSFKHELGRGGYGSVYKGRLVDGRLMAVKVLNTSKRNGEDFINEVASMGRTCHVNVVTLLGFCYEHKKRALIYEFMSNGSLEKFVYHKIPLTTDQHLGSEKLYEIVLGIARGLEYLHSGCNTHILHFDIEPHNILLDEDFYPKISDFGLAKLYPKKESIVSMLEARGTIGYIAPEVFSRNFGGVSHKSDVYNYGMMVLEMVGERKNIDAGVCHTSEIYFPHWIYNQLELDQDKQLQGLMTIEENEIAKKMILMGLWCIQTDPSQRPSMNMVIRMLEGSIEALKIPPKPFLYSSLPRSPHHPSTTTTLPI